MHDAQTGYLDTVYSTKNTTVVQDLDYLFDSLGNVKQRVDQFQTLTENFTYDNLNRVTSIDTILDPSTTNTVTIVYDSLGNITNKTDVGAYTYGQAHVACAPGFAGPHAVTTIAGTKNATYCYDANGNMVTGDGRTVTYSAFDKPTLIVKGTNSVAITYGPGRARFKRVDVATSGTTTTHYVGGKAYEEIFKPGGTIERKHYIGGFTVVTETELTSQAPTVQTDYLLRDHLGSLDVITDELGAVVTKLSFDAWGKRRESNWTPMADPTLFASVVTTRGFTGHEQLDSVGLVHMNGRVYDAEIGRFLSADPNIQDVENLQSWNRYTYVLNNPLSFTDPDGFFFKKIFKAIGKAFGKVFNFLKKNFKAILQIAITAIACANPAAFATCAAVTVATSFGFTLADGGSIGDALKAAAFAAVSVGVFRGTGLILKDIAGIAGNAFFAVKSAVHGIVGGALSMAQGGSFLQGFAANAIGAAAGLVSDGISRGNAFLDTIIVSAAGGVGAELTGGKFGNGALTAAFGNIFNKWGDYLWAGAEVAGSFVPGVGEALDIAVIADPEAFFWQKAVAAVSLLANVATGGLLPNAGGFIRGGGRIANAIGRAGEDAVRAVTNIGDKIPISVNGRTRIPDGITDANLTEVKNVGKLHFSTQLRDFSQFAQDEGLDFTLWTRPSTQLSGPLREAISSGQIRQEFIPGTN